jgi:hypothetical protein
MIEYKWKIDSLKNYSIYQGKENVIFQINYMCVAIKNGKDAVSYGEVLIDYDANKSFSPYENLTEAQILDWVYSKINKNEIEENLKKHIDEILELELNNNINIKNLPFN